MCGRYVVDVDREEMQKIVDAVNRALTAREETSSVKVGEIYPTDIAPVSLLKIFCKWQATV